MHVIALDHNQITYICDLFTTPEVIEFCNKNDWYKNFCDGVRYDLIKKQVITEKQLYQVRKISDFFGLTWRLII